MRIVSSIIALFMTVNSALASGKLTTAAAAFAKVKALVALAGYGEKKQKNVLERRCLSSMVGRLAQPHQLPSRPHWPRS